MPQRAHTFHSQGRIARQLSYLLYRPRQYAAEADRRWPLIFFLHGAGERGSDIELLKSHGMPRLVEQYPDFPFVVVSPQCPDRSWWQMHVVTAELLLNQIVATLAVDADRVYLTGLSMGGFGAWYMGARHPERFAAVAPICGYGLASCGFPQRVCNLRDVPVWTFHGAQDNIVPLEDTQKLVDNLRACGGNVRFTIYPDATHDSWTRTYSNPELYEWFLRHTRRRRLPQPD
jgi:predicted peptidase